MSDTVRMGLCLEWVREWGGDMWMGVGMNVERVRRMDGVCKELMLRGTGNGKGGVETLFVIVKMVVLVGAVGMTVNYFNKLVAKRTRS